VTFTANAQGFRTAHDLEAVDGRTRIVVLGDSMVFGVGVEAAERFTELLEGREPGWRLDNLGMVAYGPDLMLRALEAVALAPRPDVVVFALFSHDFYRVAPVGMGVGFPIPRYELADGELVTVPYPVRSAWQGLFIVQGVRYFYWRYTSASLPLNAAILSRFLALADTHGFRPAVVFIPGPRVRFDDRWRQQWLRDWTASRGTPFFDLTEPLEKAGLERLYIADDAHWNPEGHRVVAHQLHPFVAGLVGAR
jgi:lysophospholipase L1-like esterase